VSEQRNKEDARGLPEGLRTAIERTFAATAEGAAGTRDRAEGMLDEVARRGREARQAVSERAQDARESSAGAAAKVIDAVEGMRVANREDLRELSGQVAELSKQVDRLETRVRTLETQPKAEG
jgi:polyhydroxyalkanoate synthesis regulator phasin